MVEGGELTKYILWLTVVLLAAFCVVLLTVNVWGLHFLQQPLDYKHFGTWTQAISSAATFVGVMVALASLLWQQAKTRKETSQKEIEEHTAVFLWLNSQVLQDENTHEPVGRHWDLEVRNLTKAPIYRWRVEFSGLKESLSHATRRPLLPDQNVFNLPFLDNCTPQEIPIPTIYFQARDGLAWKRSATGLISQASVQQLQVGTP